MSAIITAKHAPLPLCLLILLLGYAPNSRTSDTPVAKQMSTPATHTSRQVITLAVLLQKITPPKKPQNQARLKPDILWHTALRGDIIIDQEKNVISPYDFATGVK